MNSQIIYFTQIILSVILIALILIQTRGTGLGSAFGADFSFYSTKRGAERMFFIMTIVIAILFLLSSSLAILL